jgi:uncharacterized protein
MTFPAEIEPIGLARNQTYLVFDVPLARCERLQALSPQTSDARLELRFGFDGRIPFIKGNLTAPVNVICERCNLPMTIQLAISLSLSPVLNDEKAKHLPVIYDPIVIVEGVFNTIDMVEEELLLALPMVPKHESMCVAQFPEFST